MDIMYSLHSAVISALLMVRAEARAVDAAATALGSRFSNLVVTCSVRLSLMRLAISEPATSLRTEQLLRTIETTNKRGNSFFIVFILVMQR